MANEIEGTPHYLPPENAPLNEATFQALRELLASQAHDELGFGGFFFIYGNPDNPGYSLADWYHYATATDLDKLPQPGGQTPWQYINASCRQLSAILENRWKYSDGSFAYLSELNELIQHLNTHLVGGDDYDTSEMDVAKLLEAAYGLEVLYKRDLAELARKTSDAFEAIEHTSFGDKFAKVALATIGVAVAVVTGGVGAVVESFVGGALVAAGAAAGAAVVSEGLDELEVGGMEGKDVAEKFSGVLQKIVESYQKAAQKIAGDLDDLAQNLATETKNEKFDIPVPTVGELTAGFTGVPSLGQFRDAAGGSR
jgi:hypothetical protein